MKAFSFAAVPSFRSLSGAFVVVAAHVLFSETHGALSASPSPPSSLAFFVPSRPRLRRRRHPTTTTTTRIIAGGSGGVGPRLGASGFDYDLSGLESKVLTGGGMGGGAVPGGGGGGVVPASPGAKVALPDLPSLSIPKVELPAVPKALPDVELPPVPEFLRFDVPDLSTPFNLPELTKQPPSILFDDDAAKEIADAATDVARFLVETASESVTDRASDLFASGAATAELAESLVRTASESAESYFAALVSGDGATIGLTTGVATFASVIALVDGQNRARERKRMEEEERKKKDAEEAKKKRFSFSFDATKTASVPSVDLTKMTKVAKESFVAAREARERIRKNLPDVDAAKRFGSVAADFRSKPLQERRRQILVAGLGTGGVLGLLARNDDDGTLPGGRTSAPPRPSRRQRPVVPPPPPPPVETSGSPPPPAPPRPDEPTTTARDVVDSVLPDATPPPAPAVPPAASPPTPPATTPPRDAAADSGPPAPPAAGSSSSSSSAAVSLDSLLAASASAALLPENWRDAAPYALVALPFLAGAARRSETAADPPSDDGGSARPIDAYQGDDAAYDKDDAESLAKSLEERSLRGDGVLDDDIRSSLDDVRAALRELDLLRKRRGRERRRDDSV